MRRFISLLGLSLTVAIAAGCCGLAGHHDGAGWHHSTHGVCDCDVIDPCYLRAPWAIGIPTSGDVLMQPAVEDIKGQPKVDKKQK